MTINMAVNSCFYCLMTLICIQGSTSALRIIIEGPESNRFNESEHIARKGENVTITCYHEDPIEWTYPENQSDKPIEVSTDYTQSSPDDYKAMISIYDVDHSAVGFYTCRGKYDKFVNISTYLYVEGASQLYVGLNEDTIGGQEYRPLTIPCKPTAPNIEVELYQMDAPLLQRHYKFDPKIGYVISNEISDLKLSEVSCHFSTEYDAEVLLFEDQHFNYMNQPEISNGTSEDFFAEGYPLNLICMVNYDSGRITPDLKWLKDGHEISAFDDRIHIPSIPHYENYKVILHLSIASLVKATDAGRYACKAYDNDTSSESHTDVDILKRGFYFINIDEENRVYNISANAHENVTWGVHVSAFPRANIEWRNDQNQLIRSNDNNGKYFITVEGKKHILQIHNVTVSDIGTYTIKAHSKNVLNTSSFHLVVRGPPSIDINVKPFYLVNSISEVSCSVKGYPQPEVQLLFKPCRDDGCKFEKPVPQVSHSGRYTTTVTISVQTNQSGSIRCIGNNSFGATEVTKPYIITDVEDGFQIWAEENDETIRLSNKEETVKMAYRDEVTFYCASTKQNYTDKIEWYYNDKPIDDDRISKSITEYSYKIQFSIKALAKSDTGKYTCKAEKDAQGKEIEGRIMRLKVTEPEKPTIVNTNLNQTMDNLIFPGEHKLYCIFGGVPRPRVTWTKDGHDYIPDGTRVKFENDSQQIHFVNTDIVDEGTYECTGKNKVESTKKSAFMGFSNTGKMNPYVYGIIAVLFVAILVVLICLGIRIRKENELKRVLRSVGLEHFEKGQVESINPEIGIDDQAELLPYHKEHWEIPRQSIKLGKQLGAGAFGVVMKAEALGVKGEKESTTVAVKTVKKNVDDFYLRALCSELKIMSHLGSHVNVVNLIGACTGNIAKRELLVVVEFCRFGNLHNYLLRHRGNFINQIDPDSNVIDYNIGADLLERSFSVSSNQSQDTSAPKDMQDYREHSNNTAHTQYTATTTVCMTPTGQDEPLTSNNSIQPDWRSNYKGDYKGKIKPISTKDLLTWAFQVARGMEYLASRKVLHGDLAARNILLSDNDVVKICDFGLAKRMYKDDNYKKQNNSPLPIKWMAIESITDRVFSTQSDVWSFGIVMWEFFSLAKTPYPGMEADERLYHKLVAGYRMDSPPYATPEIYKIMSDCWETKPLKRPTFTKLAEHIGSLLEQAVLRHYIDLNDPYLQMNTKLFEDFQSDYLQMASPPDFASLSTPQYINYDSGISSPTPGQPYMLMKPAHIFSPRILPDGEVFTFDNIKKDNQRMECVEMTPMLNLKDLDNLSKPNSPEPDELPSYSNPSYNKMPLVNENVLKTKDNYVNMPENKTKTDFINGSDKNNDGSHHYVNSVSRDWERDIIRA